MRSPVPLVMALALAGLCACSAQLPEATARPSFVQTCAPRVPEGATALTCEAAVSAALGSLPPSHPRILKVEFYYGTPCDPTAAPCPIGNGVAGYVVVRMATPDSDQLIHVAANPDGTVAAGGPLLHAPAP